MAHVQVDFTKRLGKVKMMHAGGQPPLYYWDTSDFHYMTDAGIPQSRLHDAGGAYGRNQFVDVPNIFRDFSADENDPASYAFEFTDFLIGALVEAGVEPYFRLGVTIENARLIRRFTTLPPEDFEKGRGGAHGVDEVVSIARLKRAMKIYARALLYLGDLL